VKEQITPRQASQLDGWIKHLRNTPLPGELIAAAGLPYPFQNATSELDEPAQLDNVRRLLCACAFALSGQKWAADSDFPAGIAPERAAVAAALALRETDRPGHSLCSGSRQKLCAAAGRACRRLRVIETIAGCGGIASANLLAPGEISRFQAQADDFEAAIRPRMLSTLRPKDLKDRAKAFARNLPLSDKAVLDEAKKILRRTLSVANAEHLLGLLGMPRIRTYSQETLKQIASNYDDWNPLVEYLRTGNVSGSASKAEIDAQIISLLDRLKNAIGGKWRVRSRPDIDDAAAAAVTAALADLRSPAPSYCYETAFHAWLITAAGNRLTGRRSRGAKSLHVKNPVVVTPSTSSVEEMQDHAERYLLVEAFFKKGTANRVKVLWGIMLSDAGGGTRTAVKEMQRIILRETSVRVPINTITTDIRRLRRRFRVLQYVLDGVPGGKPDESGDVSVIGAVEPHLPREAVPTVRALAALGRAARNEGDTLLWALLARLMIRLARPEKDIRAFLLPVIRERSRLHLGSCRDMVLRLHDAVRWGRCKANADAIRELRRTTTRDGFGFWLAACWYLVNLQGISAGPARGVLLPESKKAGVFDTMAKDLASLGDVR